MLIHASKRWPQAITANLWPYALRAANDAINEVPNLQHKSKLSPANLFSKALVNPNPKHYRPFGCPVYVLDSELQEGKPYHKWKERSRVGIYLGRSPQHNRNVALVLNRITGLVSPQFHITFDPSFQTIKQDKHDSGWQIKAGFKVLNEETSQAQREPAQKRKPAPTSQREQRGSKKQKRTAADKQPSHPEWANEKIRHFENKEQEGIKDQSKQAEQTSRRQRTQKYGNILNSTAKGSTTTRSGRESRPVQRLMMAMLAEIEGNTQNEDRVDYVQGEIFCESAMFPRNDIALQQDPLVLYKATADPDTMYLHQAMKQPDKKEFVDAMVKEVKTHLDKGNFSVIHKSKVPKRSKILPMVWQMKRKRDIKTGKIKKHKARLNVDGSKTTHGIHYHETYAPVASWNSIRMLLILSIVHGWYTKQVDNVLAYPQAPAEKPLYMKIPKGMEVREGNNEDYVLMLHQNVYGQKNAGRVWNKYLVDKLVNVLKFKQSTVDECVFYRGNVLYVLYTDDSILAGPNRDEIEQVLKELKEAKLDITDEGDVKDFLGVNIEKQNDGTIHMTQPHLIDQILKDLNMNGDDVKIKDTPAASSRLLDTLTQRTLMDHSTIGH